MRKLAILGLLIASVKSFAVGSSIYCETPRGKKVFNIQPKKVSFHIDHAMPAHAPGSGRSLASLSADIHNVRTKRMGNSITKILNFEGQKHTIHIQDVNNFSEVDDYISIRSKQGHEIIYPLNCSHE